MRRIQRKRIKGWKMPPNTVYVGRPTKWGNPWTVEKYWDAGYSGSEQTAAQHCVDAFRAWLEGRDHWAHGELKPIPDLAELRGKNLACWCPLDQPCPADVLIKLCQEIKP